MQHRSALCATTLLLLPFSIACAVDHAEPDDDSEPSLSAAGKADGVSIPGITPCESNAECGRAEICLLRSTLPRSVSDALTAKGYAHTPGSHSGICRARYGRQYGVEFVDIRVYPPDEAAGYIIVTFEIDGAVQFEYEDELYYADSWARARDNDSDLYSWSYADAFSATQESYWPVEVPAEMRSFSLTIVEDGIFSDTPVHSFSSNALPRGSSYYGIRLESETIKVDLQMVPSVGADEEQELLALIGG